MKKQLIVLAGLFAFLNTTAQIRGGFENNSQWYIDDKKIKIDPKEADDRFRSNSYLKLDYDYKNWSFGTQIEAYEPKALLNYSPEYDGVNFGTVHARYFNQELGLDVTAGHFYDQFGSGLLFRAWEDRQLGVNNAILGLNAKYNLDTWGRVTALGGKQRIGMGFDLSNSILFGADFEIYLGDLFSFENTTLNFGASYLGTQYEENIDNKGLNNYKGGYALRLDYSDGGFHAGAEYVKREPDYIVATGLIRNKGTQTGEGLLINTGYSQKGMSIDVNLRRIQSMANYSEREFYGNEFLQGVVNYIPALTKQYDYSLQNIYVYQAQSAFDYNLEKEGEIGGQFDFYYDFKKGSTLGGKYGTNLVVNGSYWAGLKTTKDIDAGVLNSEFLGIGEKYYKDLGIEVRKKWSPNWSSIFMYLNQFYNNTALIGKGDNVNTHIISGETTYQFMDDKSVRLEMQHMWADADKKNWVGGTLEFALNNRISVFASDMYNYGNDDKDQRIHYYNAGASYTVGTTRIAASYGRQRGGLLCVGGVCRYVSEAAGLTIGITTSF